MSEATTDYERERRGSRAAELLKDEVLVEALREVARSAHRLFEQATDQAQLQRARMLLEAQNQLVLLLRTTADHGSALTRQRRRLESKILKGARLPTDELLREVV